MGYKTRGTRVEPGIWRVGPNLYRIDVHINDGLPRRAALVHGNIHQAREERVRIHRSILARKNCSLTFQTVAEVLDHYVETRYKFTSRYRNRFGRQLITQLKAGLGTKRITARGEDRLPGDLAVDDIENFLVRRQAEVIENKKSCTASYLDTYVVTLKAAFNHCRVRCDAVTGLEHRKVQKSRKTIIPDAALQKIRKDLPRSVQAVMLFKESVPCRCWELYNLEVEQVDTAARKIALRADQTKNEEARELPIPTMLLPYFEWIVSSGSRWAFPRITTRKKTGELVFNKMLSNYVSSQWRKVRRAQGLPEEIKFRLLRHNVVSKYLHNGVPGGVVADIMGASEETMRTFYEVVPLSLKNQEADRIAGIKHGGLTESLDNILPFKAKTAIASA